MTSLNEWMITNIDSDVLWYVSYRWDDRWLKHGTENGMWTEYRDADHIMRPVHIIHRQPHCSYLYQFYHNSCFKSSMWVPF